MMYLTLALACMTLVLGIISGTPSCPAGCDCAEDIIYCEDTAISLTQDSIPNATTVKNVIFQRCYLPTIAPNTFSMVTNITSVLFVNIQIGVIQGNAFNGMTGAEPDFQREGEEETGILFSNVSITTIAKDAFNGLKNLQYIVFGPAEVGIINTGAFANSEIDNILINYANVKTIASRAFGDGLEKTKGLYITAGGLGGESGIPGYAFAGIKNAELKIHSVGMATIHANAFAVENVSLTLASCLFKKISTNAFDGARNMRSVNLSKLLFEEIETGIFGDMTGNAEERQSMTNTVILSEMALTRIRSRAFEGLSGFSDFIFTKNLVECVEEDAFDGIDCPVTNTENLYETKDDCPIGLGTVMSPSLVSTMIVIVFGYLALIQKQ